jgi:UPF0755 protein
LAENSGYDRVPDARLRKKHRPAATRVFFSLFGLLLFGGLAAAVAGFYGYQEFLLPGPLAEKKVFTVAKGLGVPDIAVALQENGIISDARVFSAITYLKRARGGGALKAGEYQFAEGATMRDVMALIESGKSITYKVSVPEGFTSFAALARVTDNDVLTGEVTEPPAEGAILPDTYVFKRGLTKQKMIDDMEDAQAKLLEELWSQRNPAIPLKTKEEAVVLASIVEKETAKPDERGQIASVFYNRLKQGMRLQSDPTIIYGITLGQGKLERALTKADITTPTPYNTYTIDGLPPGPIANPGRAALEAVLNPPDTKYLYFVADGSGGHAFAETLDEHNKNVADWRKIDAAAPASAMEENPAPEQTVLANTLPEIATPAEPVPDAAAGGAQQPAAQSETANAAPETAETTPAPETAEPNPAPEAATTDGLPAAPEPTLVTPQTAETAETAEAPAETTATEPPKLVPKPRPKPEDLLTAAAEILPELLPGEPKPGSVIFVGKRLIPIPKNKPKS